MKLTLYFSTIKKSNGDRSFFIGILQNLYHTKAKLVLMSGTPNLTLLDILQLHHIQIQKAKEIKATINIHFSRENNIVVAERFARNTIIKNGTESLNIIYRKSIKDCHNICDRLTEIGFTANVLTASEKEETTYKSIAEIENVPLGIQFIVTTNVISTGANIQNTNIGSALMLNEYDPAEIKQFSKRFRKKADIEIELVNKPIEGGATLNESQLQKQRDYLKDSLIYHSKCQDNLNYDFDFDKSFYSDNHEYIDPTETNNRILETYLKSECSVLDNAVKSISTVQELAGKLNNYDDIIAHFKTSTKTVELTKLKASDSSWDKKTKLIIEDFSNNIPQYISALQKANYDDWSDNNGLKILTHDEYDKNITPTNDILDNIKSPFFIHEILPLFLKYRAHFKTTKDFVIYLKSKNNKSQNIIPIQLMFNEKLHRYFNTNNITYSKNTNLKLELKDNKQFNDLNKENKVILYLIKEVFKYSIHKKKSITIKGLKSHLEKDSELFQLLNDVNDFRILESGIFQINQNSFEFKNDNLLKALVNGLFYTEEARIGTDKATSSKFKEELPSGHSNIKLETSKSTQTFVKDGKNINVVFGSLNSLKGNTKIINSYELILKELRENS